MTNTKREIEESMDLDLNSVLNQIEKKKFDETKVSFEKLKSQKNAYTCSPEAKWNMITYKKGLKSIF